MNNKKKFGIEYTPSDLSNFMAKKLRMYTSKNRKKLNILDPACGDGNLLLALENNFDNYEAIGIDTDKQALNKASKILNKKNNRLIHEDYIDLIKNKTTKKQFDLVIANPPYISTSNLGSEKSKKLSENFHISGKIDMYQVFLKAITTSLKIGGVACVITSNKYLTTKSGKDIRKFLNENYKILELIDLGDSKPFSAAVLPAIFIGKKIKNVQNDRVAFSKIYECKSNNNMYIEKVSSITDILVKKEGKYQFNSKVFSLTKGKINLSDDPDKLWNLATGDENKWVKEIENKAKFRFDDVFKIHVGIKTTADKVFIKENWEQLEKYLKPEKELLHQLISSKKISKWIVEDKEYDRILYTYTIKKNKRELINFDKYPKAWKYLNSNKDILENRKYFKKSNKKWFEIWVPQQPSDMEKNKVVFPDISENAKFLFDNKGFYVDGNCYWMITKENVDMEYLLLATGVANSKLMAKYHDIKFQNRLYSGRKRYSAQYVKKYLLPNINNVHSQNIINIMKKIIELEKYNKSDEDKINREVELAFT